MKFILDTKDIKKFNGGDVYCVSGLLFNIMHNNRYSYMNLYLATRQKLRAIDASVNEYQAGCVVFEYSK